MRFQVIINQNNKYNILDTTNDKLCAYSGKAFNPPLYALESKCDIYEWNNYHSALGFAERLEHHNKQEGIYS